MVLHKAVTIGMRIDTIIAFIKDVPATYHLFLVLCFVFSCTVLNIATGTTVNDPQQQQEQCKEFSNKNTDPIKSSRNNNDNSDEPQPKWHILKILNIAAVVGFLTSIGYFAFDASAFMNDSGSLLKFLACWSVFVCYFFGFFGISFIDEDVLIEDEQQQQQHQHHQKLGMVSIQNAPADAGMRPSAIDLSMKKKHAVNSPPSLHPPASCTPVCTDPPSKPKTSPPMALPPPETTSDKEWADMVLSNKIKDHQLEKILDPHRAVVVRRLIFRTKLCSPADNGEAEPSPLDELPHEHSLDYTRVHGANCETVVGYVPLPVGMVGPLTLNDRSVYFPMATTEGCLVASTNRGCKAISQGSGAVSTIVRDGITRAPCLKMRSAREAAELKIWCEMPENFARLKEAFESTTGFGKLQSASTMVAGRNAYVRLCCFSGDAMGMNMVSKGTLAVVDLLRDMFPTLELVALSGNVCTDKKPSAINWIEGRGKSVIVEATIPKDVVQTTLKTNVKTIVRVNIDKNLIGSALAGSIGGFNAHAANIVTAIFLATGQDPAQNVESSNCMTLMEETDNGDLWISCTMPSIEVGTVGGGTGLPAQKACLKVIGCQGGGAKPGENSRQLAHVVASATMAGELSLMAALSANTLVQAHMQHNRKPATTNVVDSK